MQVTKRKALRAAKNAAGLLAVCGIWLVALPYIRFENWKNARARARRKEAHV